MQKIKIRIDLFLLTHPRVIGLGVSLLVYYVMYKLVGFPFQNSVLAETDDEMENSGPGNSGRYAREERQPAPVVVQEPRWINIAAKVLGITTGVVVGAIAAYYSIPYWKQFFKDIWDFTGQIVHSDRFPPAPPGLPGTPA